MVVYAVFSVVAQATEGLLAVKGRAQVLSNAKFARHCRGLTSMFVKGVVATYGVCILLYPLSLSW